MSVPAAGEPLPVHRDARGWVAQPIGAEQLPAQRNVHVAVTAPGAVRGNHRHPRGTEVLVVTGPALVRVRASGPAHDTVVPAGEVYRFTFPPGVAHAVKNTGEAPAVLVAFSDEASPEVVPDPLLD